MVFSVVIIVMVAGVAYFHMAQGFFSATMSAVCAVIAATLAVSYHEAIVAALLKGKMSDYANGFVLIAVFALVYIILRSIFDKAVPGNVRLPVIADRAGGIAMGLIAGLFTAGVFALAAESMPFGPALGMYARYPVEDRQAQVMLVGAQRNQDVDVPDTLKSDHLSASDKSGILLFPADELLCGFVEKLSDGGSLAGDTAMSVVHPSYPDELFAQRLGIQVGAKHTAVNLEGVGTQVTVADPGVFKPEGDLIKGSVDAEISTVRERAVEFKPESPETFPLVVRVMFGKEASDPEDSLVRLSPGAVRLVAGGVNYFPVGTLENQKVLWLNRVDDPMFVSVRDKDRGADFVFYVDPDKVITGDPKSPKIADNVFIEVKRLAKVDLSGKSVEIGVTSPKDPSSIEVLRKPMARAKAVKSGKGGGGGGSGSSSATPGANAPFVFSSATESSRLFTPINVGTADASVNNQQIAGGTLSMQGKKFTKLDLAPTESLARLKAGSYTIDELFEPPGQKLVQIIGAPPAEGGDGWGWANNVKNFTLVDGSGKSYIPCGAWAKVKESESDKLMARYDSNGVPIDVSAANGRPTDVWIAFLVPVGTQLKALNYSGQQVAEVSIKVQ